MYSLNDGELAVKIAREVISKHLQRKSYIDPDIPEIFHNKAGVFVTLEISPSKELRGCIGFPEPVFPLIKAIKNAAVSAAFDDPRFRPVTLREMNNIIIEVSLLTSPELIKVSNPREYPKHIIIGQDGLIAEKGWAKGLLLPQVPVEQNWTVDEFLEQICWKAGMTPDSWLDQDCKIYKFQAEIFSEVDPNGKIIQRDINKK